MTASEVTIMQLADLFEDMINLDYKDHKVWVERIREIEGSKSVRQSCEALAKELERRWGLTS